MHQIPNSLSFQIFSPTTCVSGQTIKLSGSLQNNSNKAIEFIKASFCTSIKYRKDPLMGTYKVPETLKTYITARPVSEEIEREVELYRGVGNSLLERTCIRLQTFSVPPGKTREFLFPVVIPPVVATINNCKLILVEYSIKLTVKFGSQFKRDAEAHVEMLVGNVPVLAPGQSEG